MSALFNIGFSELLLILLVAFVIVGPKDLPKVARSMARGIRQLRQLFAAFKEESGLEETIQELKQEAEGADPTATLRAVRQEAEKIVDETKQST